MPRIAAAAYPLDFLATWPDAEAKLTRWVSDAAAQNAELLVFPEYAAMELATLEGRETAADLDRSIDAVTKWLPRLDELLCSLAARHNLHICAPTGPVRLARDRTVNRARLISPGGATGIQDKLIPTPWEREDWSISPGENLSLFVTALGRIGILICYDAEFPLLARALIEAGAEILLVPSATETVAGYTRVRIAAMARALEGQCVVAQAPLTGPADWSEAVDINHGRAGIFTPPDTGLPETGILAQGAMDAPGWTIADADLGILAKARREGGVRGVAHWPEQDGRILDIARHSLT